jgi:multidrug transporter EmrE-like cation transporter
MYLFIAIIAALSYSVGGIFMKLSEGYEKLVPTILVYLFFLGGASLQIWLLSRNPNLGVNGLIVSGLDALCTVLFGILLFKEGYTSTKLVGIFLVVVGAIFLRSETA